jgi:hypothetical protein
MWNVSFCNEWAFQDVPWESEIEDNPVSCRRYSLQNWCDLIFHKMRDVPGFRSAILRISPAALHVYLHASYCLSHGFHVSSFVYTLFRIAIHPHWGFGGFTNELMGPLNEISNGHCCYSRRHVCKQSHCLATVMRFIIIWELSLDNCILSTLACGSLYIAF